MVIAAAVAALCLAFLIGYASHGGARAAADPGKSPARTRPAAPPVTTGARPHSRRSSTPPAAAPRGPLRRNSAGVIVGYSHDQAGAVAAAGNYTASLYVQTNRTHARELAVLSTIAASQADAERMAGDFSTEDAALAQAARGRDPAVRRCDRLRPPAGLPGRVSDRRRRDDRRVRRRRPRRRQRAE